MERTDYEVRIALADSPDDEIRLALALLKAGDLAEGAELLRMAAPEVDAAGDAWLLLEAAEVVAERLGDPHRALELLECAVGCAEESGDAVRLAFVALAMQRLGHRSASSSLFEAALAAARCNAKLFAVFDIVGHELDVTSRASSLRRAEHMARDTDDYLRVAKVHHEEGRPADVHRLIDRAWGDATEAMDLVSIADFEERRREDVPRARSALAAAEGLAATTDEWWMLARGWQAFGDVEGRTSVRSTGVGHGRRSSEPDACGDVHRRDVGGPRPGGSHRRVGGPGRQATHLTGSPRPTGSSTSRVERRPGTSYGLFWSRRPRWRPALAALDILRRDALEADERLAVLQAAVALGAPWAEDFAVVVVRLTEVASRVMDVASVFNRSGPSGSTCGALRAHHGALVARLALEAPARAKSVPARREMARALHTLPGQVETAWWLLNVRSSSWRRLRRAVDAMAGSTERSALSPVHPLDAARGDVDTLRRLVDRAREKGVLCADEARAMVAQTMARLSWAWEAVADAKELARHAGRADLCDSASPRAVLEWAEDADLVGWDRAGDALRCLGPRADEVGRG